MVIKLSGLESAHLRGHNRSAEFSTSKEKMCVIGRLDRMRYQFVTYLQFALLGGPEMWVKSGSDPDQTVR